MGERGRSGAIETIGGGGFVTKGKPETDDLVIRLSDRRWGLVSKAELLAEVVVADEHVSVSGADTTPGKLDTKLVVSAPLVKTIESVGGDERLRVSHGGQHGFGDLTGVLSDAQHGARGIANAHAHSDLSDAPADAHHVAFVSVDADALIATHAAIAGVHHAEYLDSDAIAAVEGEATLDLSGAVTVALGLGVTGDITLATASSALKLHDAGIEDRTGAIRIRTSLFFGPSDPMQILGGGLEITDAGDITIKGGGLGMLNTLRVGNIGIDPDYIIRAAKNVAPISAIAYGGSFVLQNVATSGVKNTIGLAGEAQWSGSGAAGSAYARGLDFIATHNSPNALNELTGIVARIQVSPLGTGALLAANGLVVPSPIWNAAEPDTMSGIDIFNQGHGDIDTLYVLRIREQTGAISLTRIISQEGSVGHNVFAAPSRFGDTGVPTEDLEVANNALIEGNLELDGDLNHDGSNVGFYATAPVAKQTGVAVSAGAIHAALVNLGLIAA